LKQSGSACFAVRGYLPDDGGLADLPRASQYLHDAALFFEPFQRFVMDDFTYHDILLNTLSKFTQ
jgi:hypothetical protein